MCGSEELIHDARQVDLEEMIMTNETPMYLVPGRLTVEQETHLRDEGFFPSNFLIVAKKVGTPIRPCADVETTGWVDPKPLAALACGHLTGITLAGYATPARTVPLVRRTDMEAQVARVAAEKAGEIEGAKKMLRPILTKLDYAAHELEQTEHAQSVHQLAHICLSLLSDEESIRKRALAELAALNEGTAG